MTDARRDADPSDKPLIVVSADSHVGPRLEQDLRPYCPRELLGDYDDFVREHRAKPLSGFAAIMRMEEGPPEMMKRARALRSNAGDGHYDMDFRLREMDRDGTAAEVIFHSSQNGETLPFLTSQGSLFLVPAKERNLEHTAAGIRIYNRWLADAVKHAPERLIGAALLPQWDVDLCVQEVEWARKAGLQAVTLLAWREGLKAYDDPEWEPMWAACEANAMPLCAHSGIPFPEVMTPASGAMVMIEGGGWIARQASWRMVFAGAFERHPGLRLILTEQNADWWVPAMREWDSVYLNIRHNAPHLKRRPSEYARDNIFIGASFMAPFEARDAVDNDYVDNVIWGRDYPHIEGTYIGVDDNDIDHNPTRLSMRYAFSDIPAEAVRKMTGETGLRVYGLDRAKLAAVAERIGAPSLNELSTPIPAIPENGGMLAFRQVGAWG